MTKKEIIIQERTRYVKEIHNLDQQIFELQEQRREYEKVVKLKDRELMDELQGSLF